MKIRQGRCSHRDWRALFFTGYAILGRPLGDNANYNGEKEEYSRGHGFSCASWYKPSGRK
jgi:hypothetical protein